MEGNCLSSVLVDDLIEVFGLGPNFDVLDFGGVDLAVFLRAFAGSPS